MHNTLLKLHHEAVDCILHGGYLNLLGAIEPHRQALKLVSRILSDQLVTPKRQGNHHPFHQAAPRSPTSVLTMGTTANPQMSCTIIDVAIPPSAFLVWNKTLKIEDMLVDAANLNSTELTMVSAVILYNLALTFHIQALTTGCSEFLERAHGLYAHAMMAFRSDLSDLRRSKTATFLYVAILTNRACLHAMQNHAGEINLIVSELCLIIRSGPLLDGVLVRQLSELVIVLEYSSCSAASAA